MQYDYLKQQIIPPAMLQCKYLKPDKCKLYTNTCLVKYLTSNNNKLTNNANLVDVNIKVKYKSYIYLLVTFDNKRFR